jgi:hypothetical protein
VKANYGQMLFNGAEAGFDYLAVSGRALQRIDFTLHDSFEQMFSTFVAIIGPSRWFDKCTN